MRLTKFPEVRRIIAETAKCTGGLVSAGFAHVRGAPAHLGRSFGILMYHRVAERPAGAARPTWNVTPARFRRQLEGLLKSGWTVRPLRELLALAKEGRPVPDRSTVMTFDDGYACVYRNAWPVLRELAIPATVFVTTAHLGSKQPFPFDAWGCGHARPACAASWEPLDWDQCREMQASGVIEIGTHSHTHADFRGRPAGLEEDLRASLSALRRELGARDYAFSFPYGGTGPGFAGRELQRAARSAGAICALTTDIGQARSGTDGFGWGRYEVVECDSPATLRAKLDGWYDWMAGARDAFRRLISYPTPRG